MAPRFGTDGLRGVANSELTAEVAFVLGQAAAEVLRSDQVVLGRDTRLSGPLLESALTAGFCSVGVDVELLGVVPTPTVAWVSKQRNVAAAMISASHNPFQDNGIKLFAKGGTKLPDNVEQQIQEKLDQYLASEVKVRPVGADVGTVVPTLGFSGWQDLIISSVDEKMFDGLKIVVDCANGAAHEVGPKIFSGLGAEVISIGVEPDGVNINAGVGSTDTQLLQKTVLEAGADLGLAFDGDADRLIAVDERGNRIDGDRVIAVLAKDFKARGLLKNNSVVVTVMTNLGFHRAMTDEGIETQSTKVGDRYVLEAMKTGLSSLGGEQSGHIICRDLATTGDGILSGVQLTAALVRSGKSFGDLASSVMSQVPQVLRNVQLTEMMPNAAELFKDKVADIESKIGGEGRVLVRPSGTEALLRIMVEHTDEDQANKLCDEIVAYVESVV